MQLDAEKSKAFFASRTVWWNALGIILFQLIHWIYPKASAICSNQELTIVVGLNLFTVWCAVNLFLRKVTSCRIGAALLALFVLSGCAGTYPTLDKNVFYKRDIVVGVNGRDFEGVVTVPYAKSYQFTVQPRGEIDLMLLKSCHRTFSVEKVSSGWFGNRKFLYNYTPVSGIEDQRVCPIRIDSYESGKEGRHSWGVIDFENPSYTVQASLDCDGVSRQVNGVGICQAKKDTVQRITFKEPVRWAPPLPETCNKPIQKGLGYELLMPLGECIYHFDTKDGRLGRLITVGFEGVLVRSPQ